MLRRHLIIGAAGVVGSTTAYFLTNTTPSAPSTVASQHSIDGAATPPRLRRGVVIMCANTEASMRKRLLATFLVFACTGFAQQRGQQPAGLTEKQWQESK